MALRKQAALGTGELSKPYVRGDLVVGYVAENTGTLYAASGKTGIERIVQLPVSNPAAEFRLSYFKAKVQDMLEPFTPS